MTSSGSAEWVPELADEDWEGDWGDVGPSAIPPRAPGTADDPDAADDDFWDCQSHADEEEEWRPPDYPGAENKEHGLRMAADFLINKWDYGKWHATDICILCFFLKMAGLEGPIGELAVRPGKKERSHYSRHLKKVVGVNERDERIEYIDVPGTDSSDGSRVVHKIAVMPPVEQLNNEFATDPTIAERFEREMAAGRLPPVYTQHRVAISSNFKAQPINLYVDGLPTTKNDGCIGFWTYFHYSPKRHLACVIK